MQYKSYKNEFLGCKKNIANTFNNVLIEKPKIKHLSNIKLLHELLFYDELSVIEISKAFKRYPRSYKTQIIINKRSFSSIRS